MSKASDIGLLEGDEAEIQKAVEALKDHGPQRWRLARARALLRERPDGPGDADTDPNADARLSEAARLIDEVLADAPDQSRALLLRGLLGQRRDRPEEAIAAFEQALELGASAALGRLVALAIEARRPEVLDRLRQRQPSLAPEIDRRAAEAALRLGRGDEAAQLAEQVRRAAPENLQAHLWHAQILNTLGQPDQAEALLQGLVNQQPENAGGWLLLIAFQANQGQRAEALATVEQMRQQAQFDQPELLLAQAYRLAGDLARADAMFDEALRKWPDDLSVLRAASDFHAVIGRTAQAEAQLRHALELDPQAAWARRRLAQLLSNRPHDHAAWSEALALIGETDRPDDEPDDRLTRGLVLSRGPEPRHRQQAVTLLEELVADLPTAATARERLVRIYLTDKQPEQALEHARVLGTAENASPSAIANYAEVLVAAERPMEEALEQLDRLAEPHRDGLRAAAIEARARYAQGQDDAGDRLLETAFDRVADAPSGPIAAGQVLTLLTDQERFEAAERVGRRVAQRWPERAYLLARVLGASGRVDEGLDLCEQTAEAGAPREAANSAVALAVLHKPTTDARLARAEALLDQARAQFPDDLTLILAQALLRHAQGRYDDEIALYHAVQERGPADYQFLNNLAWTLCEGLGRPEEALEYADEALQRLGWNPNLLDTRGVILFRLGRLDEAIPLLREAADAAPTPTILFHLARALHHNGDHDEARHTLQRAQDAGLTPELLEPHERDELKALDTSLNNGQ